MGVYMAHYSGGFSPFVFDETKSDVAASDGPAAPPDPMKIGKRVYVRNCVVCHQADGKGLPGVLPARSMLLIGFKDSPRAPRSNWSLAGLQGEVVVNGNTPATTP
jgi:hypothetical protein